MPHSARLASHWRCATGEGPQGTRRPSHPSRPPGDHSATADSVGRSGAAPRAGRKPGQPAVRPVHLAGGRRRPRGPAHHGRTGRRQPAGRGASLPALPAADQPEGVQAGPGRAALHRTGGGARRRHGAAARRPGQGPRCAPRCRPRHRAALVRQRRRPLERAGGGLRQRQRPGDLLSAARQPRAGGAGANLREAAIALPRALRLPRAPLQRFAAMVAASDPLAAAERTLAQVTSDRAS